MTAQADSRPVARPGVVLAVLAFAGSVFSVLQSLVVPALPVLQRELGTSPAGVTWIFTTYLLAASVATPIAGRLGDMFGKKRTLVVVLVILALGTLVAALATSLPVLIAGRAIQGCGGAVFPLSFGIVRDEFPRERVAGGIALISGLIGIGAGIGIVLAGPILTHLGYHWLFWIPLLALCVTIVAAVILIPESPIRAPGSVDVVGAVLFSGWLVMLLLAISEAPRWGWLTARTLGLLAGAAVVAVTWVAIERRTASPLVDMRMMALRGVWTTNLAGFLVGIGMFGSFVLIPQFAQTPTSTGYGLGSSVTQAGLYLLPSSLMMLVAAPVAGRLSARVGSKPPLVIGCVVAAVAYGLLAVEHAAGWQLYLASALIGVGVGFAFASLANLIVEAVRADQTGVATGMNAVMRSVGGAVGAQVAASILAGTVGSDGFPAERGYTISFAIMSVALIGAIAAAAAVPGRRASAHRVTLEAGVPAK